MKKNKISLTILGVLIILGLSGLTYAFFTAIVNRTNQSNNVVIQTETLALTYNGNLTTSGTIEEPGDTYTSKFTVKNTGGRTINSYNINFTDVENEVLYGEYVYELSCLSYVNYGTGSQAISGTCTGKSETAVPTTSGVMLTSTPINVGITHEYTLLVTFKDIGSEQNYNQGKEVSFKLTIE